MECAILLGYSLCTQSSASAAKRAAWMGSKSEAAIAGPESAKPRIAPHRAFMVERVAWRAETPALLRIFRVGFDFGDPLRVPIGVAGQREQHLVRVPVAAGRLEAMAPKV